VAANSSLGGGQFDFSQSELFIIAAALPFPPKVAKLGTISLLFFPLTAGTIGAGDGNQRGDGILSYMTCSRRCIDAPEREPAADLLPDLTPDGSTSSFSSREGDGSSLVWINADGGEVQPLLRKQGFRLLRPYPRTGKYLGHSDLKEDLVPTFGFTSRSKRSRTSEVRENQIFSATPGLRVRSGFFT